MIDSLYLGNGGGVISAFRRSRQYDGAAAVAIGIGGAGCDALSELKKKVYTRLIPDDPDADLPRYDHIRFLAIDSDETWNQYKHGYAHMETDECFFIDDPQIMAKMREKAVIRSNPLYNWMEIERMHVCFGSHYGAVGIRQIGRYLLIQRAGELYNKIRQLCIRAMAGRSPQLDIYIFAGLSGCTGSGGFIDTCYIVRRVLEDIGLANSGRIMGFFFLPDVVLSKPEMMANNGAVAYNSSNGYAALKELDYLMDLRAAGDRFRQSYGGNLRIDTQAAPVDLCFLISATDESGNPIGNGYRYALNVASEYVMTDLTDEDDKELTLPPHLAPVGHGVNQLRNRYGAKRAYHILGAACAEVPVRQFATYLACGFYRRFLDKVRDKPGLITEEHVRNWSRDLGIDCEGVYRAVIDHGREIELPDIDYAELRNYGPMKPGFLPQPWAQAVNDHLNRAEGVRKANCAALAHELTGFRYDGATPDSYIGRVFRRLIEESTNPERGPYYAAEMLNHTGYDLLSVVDGIIMTAEERRRDVTRVLSGINGQGCRDYVAQCSADFCNKSVLFKKKYYQIYKDAATQYVLYQDRERAWQDVVDVMTAFKSQLKELYNDFFRPLRDLLEDLKETFEANAHWLERGEPETPGAMQIIGLADVRADLDADIGRVPDGRLVGGFVEMLLENDRDWQDEARIAGKISRYIEDLFNVQINKSLSTYLYRRFPQAADPTELEACVLQQVIGPIYDRSVPLFWLNNAVFSLNAGNAFESSRLWVPSGEPVVCDAASVLAAGHPNFSIRKVGVEDRILSLRIFSGIPLYAYQGLTAMKSRYDQALGSFVGAGIHLYARTDRDRESVGWRRYLPTPLPYSLFPDMVDGGEKANALYDEGLKKGVIVKTGEPTRYDGEFYEILESEPITLPDHLNEHFRDENGSWRIGALQNEIAFLQTKREDLHRRETCTGHLLPSDGDVALGEEVVERVRRDYFIQSPVLQGIVRGELQKIETIDAAITRLNGLLEEENAYREDLETYTDAIFYGCLELQDMFGEQNPGKIKKILYREINNVDGKIEWTLCDREDRFRRCPLYQGFLTYREAPAADRAKRAVEKAVNAKRRRELCAGDGRICRQLEMKWDREEMLELREYTRFMEDEIRKDIIRFYECFVEQIRRFHESFPTEDMYNA